MKETSNESIEEQMNVSSQEEGVKSLPPPLKAHPMLS